MPRSRPTEDREQTADDRRRRTAERALYPSVVRRPASGVRFLRHLSSAILLLACGCQSNERDAMANAYYLTPHKDLHRLGRVALVELDSASNHPETAAEVSSSLFLEIQKRQVFGLTVVARENPAWPTLQENLASLQGLRQLQAAREALGCNGLLLGTVTRYEPYPHMVIALRLKLIDLSDGQLLWGLEQIWDASDKSIQKRIKKYLQDERRAGQSPLREELVAVSPLSFGKFVAYEVAGTFERPRRR